MRVLVTYASAHGSTAGIAEHIGAALREHHIEVIVAPTPSVTSLEGYDAIVLGSAIHNRRWLPTAAEFVSAHAREFGGRPVWLFSVATVGATSSALGPPATWLARKAGGIPRELRTLVSQTGARGHRVFAGVISADDWGRMGSAFLHLCGGRYGDHRDWHDIAHWSDGLANTLLGSAAGG